MTDLTRRQMLCAAAAAAIVPAAWRPALARSPEGPGFHRFKVGDIEVTILSDGARRAPLTASPSPSANLQQFREALVAESLPHEEISTFFNVLAVKSGGRLMLIDTGNGARTQAAGTGRMAQNLAAAGIEAKAVTAVLLTHFHGDHIGGLVTADNAPAFPGAEVRVPQKEWDYWLDDANMMKAAEGSNLRNGHMNVRRVFGIVPASQVSRFEWEREVVPGVTAIGTPGHTPGHTSFVIASGKEQLLVQGDVTSGIALVFVRNPDWFAGGDMDGPMAVATRRRLYDRLAGERMLTTGYHLPFPALGRIEKAGAGYRFAAVA